MSGIVLDYDQRKVLAAGGVLTAIIRENFSCSGCCAHYL